MTDAQRRAAFTHLLHSFRSSQDQAPAQRWLLLEASHVLGQQLLGLHWRSHCWMLRHAASPPKNRPVLFRAARNAACWKPPSASFTSPRPHRSMSCRSRRAHPSAA